MRPKQILGGLVAVAMVASAALAQEPTQPAGLQTGPATIAPHWTKNTSFPTAIPEGAAYYIVVRGDTLWDISGVPEESLSLAADLEREQVHEGRPLDLPGRPRRAAQGGARRRPGRTAPGDRRRPEGAGIPGMVEPGDEADSAAASLGPVTEELSLQCAEYIVQRPRGREPVRGGLRRRRGQARLRRSRHRLPQQGQQRGHEGRRRLHHAPRRLPGEASGDAARSSAPRSRPRAGSR